LDYILHLNEYLPQWAGQLGDWFYALIFVIVFVETGVVVAPFLPGDSLLFAVGALAALDDSPINLVVAGIVLCVAAITGDSTNYWIGRHMGPKVFRSDTSRFLNKKHLARAELFYERHGGKTVVLCRFLAVLRTFAPFVAGVGAMNYPKFVTYSVLGTLLWVWSFMLVGYVFGEQFKDQFHWIVLGILGFSVVLPTISYFRERAARRRAAAEAGGDPAR
jgi:membrane-associated protein